MNPDWKFYLDATKRLLVLALAVIAGVVLNGLLNGTNMWGWIIAYWTVLTVKNLLDNVIVR